MSLVFVQANGQLATDDKPHGWQSWASWHLNRLCLATIENHKTADISELRSHHDFGDQTSEADL